MRRGHKECIVINLHLFHYNHLDLVYLTFRVGPVVLVAHEYREILEDLLYLVLLAVLEDPPAQLPLCHLYRP